MDNNIVGSGGWTGKNRGCHRLRHTRTTDVGRKITPNNIIHGDGLAVIQDNHSRAKADGAFTLHRTIYNNVGPGRSDGIGLTFKKFTNWDGSIRETIDYDRQENIAITKSVELLVRNNNGSVIDGVEEGWGLLQENTFGPKIPVSIDGLLAFHEMMRDVWGKKLHVCIGGMWGPVSNPEWTRILFNELAKAGESFLGEFYDSYGKDRKNTMSAAYLIWQKYNLPLPIIKLREVTGNPNEWDDRGYDPISLFKEFIDEMYTFLNNMGVMPDYPTTALFIEEAMNYVPAQVSAYFEVLGILPDTGNGNGNGEEPDDPQIPPTAVEVRLDALEEWAGGFEK